MAGCLVAGLVYAAALYGIHKRTAMTWKLGWVFLAANYVGFVFQVHSAVPQADNPWVPAAAAAIAGAAVAVYWGYWWNRQRSYFVEPASRE